MIAWDLKAEKRVSREKVSIELGVKKDPTSVRPAAILCLEHMHGACGRGRSMRRLWPGCRGVHEMPVGFILVGYQGLSPPFFKKLFLGM